MNLTKEDISKLSYEELIDHINSSWKYDNKEQYKELANILKDELASREPTISYKCPKCGHNKYAESQIRTAGGFFSSMFDLETEKYRSITCTRCNYSEFYKQDVDAGQQVLDWLIGS